MMHEYFTSDNLLSQKITENEGGCWEYAGGRNPFGYGRIKRRGVDYLAHRYAWEITHGVIPDGLVVCHKCDNPPCCNPGHLFLGTHADNIHDMIQKGRGKGRPQDGERNANAKLNWDVVGEIRDMYRGGMNQCQIAREVGVSNGMVHLIVHNKRWVR